MSSIALHATPLWRTVAGEQVSTMRILLRRAGLLLLAGYGAIIAVSINGAITARDEVRAGNLAHANITYTPVSSPLIVLIAFLLALMVWQDEDPSRRSYHWMMPVARHTHALTRVFAGWVWLMAATTLYLLVMAATAAITERITGEPLSGHTLVAWEWLVPFTVGTIAYMFVSAAAVGSRQPTAWVVGVITLYWALIVLLTVTGHLEVANRVSTVFNGEYGASAAMLGYIDAADAVHRATYPSVARWLGSAAIWGAMSAALLAWVSYRRPESS